MRNKFLYALLLFYSINASALDLKQYLQIKQYIDQISATYNLNEEKLTKLFSEVSFNPEILKKAENVDELKKWYNYPKTLLTQKRIDNGVKFWQENKASLAKAYQEYGVPPKIIVAISGLETEKVMMVNGVTPCAYMV